ncbi:MAG TPA: hypothetical protein VGQ00_03975 [Candidatus Norongarragalinales archaeon]|jgi:hypothetical protein|nr:hypothetical protein [Candidatus Norongarragalinales archaeon]
MANWKEQRKNTTATPSQERIIKAEPETSSELDEFVEDVIKDIAENKRQAYQQGFDTALKAFEDALETHKNPQAAKTQTPEPQLAQNIAALSTKIDKVTELLERHARHISRLNDEVTDLRTKLEDFETSNPDMQHFKDRVEQLSDAAHYHEENNPATTQEENETEETEEVEEPAGVQAKLSSDDAESDEDELGEEAEEGEDEREKSFKEQKTADEDDEEEKESGEEEEETETKKARKTVKRKPPAKKKAAPKPKGKSAKKKKR